MMVGVLNRPIAAVLLQLLHGIGPRPAPAEVMPYTVFRLALSVSLTTSRSRSMRYALAHLPEIEQVRVVDIQHCDMALFNTPVRLGQLLRMTSYMVTAPVH